MAGFGSQTGFGRNFLKQLGITPTGALAKKKPAGINNRLFF